MNAAFSAFALTLMIAGAQVAHAQLGPAGVPGAPGLAETDPSVKAAQRPPLSPQESRRQIQDTCKTEKGKARQQCMIAEAQKTDCSKARNPQQCEARKQAYTACKELAGAQFKACVQEKTAPADCSQAANPALCERHKQARAACKDKLGPDHRQCLRERLLPK